MNCFLQQSIEQVSESLSEATESIKSDGTESLASNETREKKSSKKKSSVSSTNGDGAAIATKEKKKVKKGKKSDSEKENISVVSTFLHSGVSFLIIQWTTHSKQQQQNNSRNMKLVWIYLAHSLENIQQNE